MQWCSKKLVCQHFVVYSYCVCMYARATHLCDCILTHLTPPQLAIIRFYGNLLPGLVSQAELRSGLLQPSPYSK